jgi:NADPH:quinone reductase-like Zn-dependent oxidoreductase
MKMMKTVAWTLYRGDKTNNGKSIFKKETVSFENISEKEILVEPIYGCWEANMTHAIERKPIDVCYKRGESKIVLGNAGVVRALKTGSKVKSIKEGDVCVLMAYGTLNRFGYMVTAFGYDKSNTVGVLAKQTKVLEHHLVPIPRNSKRSLRQWPILSVRFSSAWSNWQVALKCWEAQVTREEYPSPYVCGWGGGVSLGELLLAKKAGFKVAMIASSDERLALIRRYGIIPIDRRQFMGLYYDVEKFQSDRTYKRKYYSHLKIFKKIINEITAEEGISIFIENIGSPVLDATLRILNHPGIITTTGWKDGINFEINRARECYKRHIHVFTHAFALKEGKKCVSYAEEHDWLPVDHSPIYSWEDIPQLAQDYSDEKISSYFPVFQVNSV